MKRDLIIGAFVLLVLITIFLVMSESESKDITREVQEENNKLVNTVTTLEKDLTESLNTVEELKEKNVTLEEDISNMEEDIASLKFNMDYKDFNEAINTIESYKKVKVFDDTKQFVSSGVGSYYIDQKGNCPCGFLFSGKTLEWRPNVILELNKFTIENGRILLTYHTAKEIGRDYQFILTNEEGWKIEDIKLEKK
ncbi:hypothetical protein ACXYMX_16865 [Sporosarcina sp. CAU 1771]